MIYTIEFLPSVDSDVKDAYNGTKSRCLAWAKTFCFQLMLHLMQFSEGH